MHQDKFADLEELHDYAESNGLAYAWEYTRGFAKWQRLLSLEQYQIVEVLTFRGTSRAMLFSRDVIHAELQATAPLRKAKPIKYARLWAKREAEKESRAAKQRRSP